MEIKLRSYEAEMLDAPHIAKDLLFQNLRELAFINKWLGGHKVSIAGLKKLLVDKNKVYLVMDVGCGGGDTLISLAQWAKKRNFQVQFIGLDIKPEAIEYAQSACGSFNNIRFICEDYNNIRSLNLNIDIFTSALFCHHFNESQLKNLITIFKDCSNLGFFINDLHRHWIAYYSIKWLTKFFSRSALVKNDAPLSVKRGFVKSDWINIINSSAASIHWKWAFRFLIVYNK